MTKPLLTTIPAVSLNGLMTGQLAKNMGWLGSAQICGRLLRLASTIVVARILTPEIFGQAAIVLTTYEFLNVLTHRSTATKLIQTDTSRLPELADTAWWLNWALCIGACLLQVAVAWPVSLLYGDSSLALPIAVMALGFLLLPPGMIHAALNLRANNLRVVARAELVQTAADAALTVALVLAGWGIWALVLPKVLMIPVWVRVHRAAVHWQAPRKIQLRGWRELACFGRDVVGSDLLTTLRQNIDYLLVGYFLGMKALGVYYFAFNAGLGIGLSVITAFGTSVYPHLCQVNGDLAVLRARFREGILTITLIAVPVVLFQSSLAPWYVPFVYGEQWVAAGAVPVLVLLCISALPRPLGEAGSQLLLASGRSRLELCWSALFTLLLVAAVLMGTRYGLLGVALAVLFSHLLAMPVYAWWASRQVFADPARVQSVPLLQRG